jgi:hypothetical protein
MIFRTVANLFGCLFSIALIASNLNTGKSMSEIIAVPQIPACIIKTYKIKGVCFCTIDGIPRIGIIKENAFPTAIVEVVKQPFSSILTESISVLTYFNMSGVKISDSSGVGEKAKGEGLEFAEVHSFYFPSPGLEDFQWLCIPKTKPFMPIYFTEIDYYGWREGLTDKLFYPQKILASATLCNGAGSNLHYCAWAWGGWYPRTGFLIHPSEPIAMQLIGLRNLFAASQPLGRPVINPYNFPPRTGHYIMPVYPDVRPCYNIGTISPVAENNLVSEDGRYLFIHFPVFECCQPCWGSRLKGPVVPR